MDLDIRTKSQQFQPRRLYRGLPESIQKQEDNKQVKFTRTR